jgi:hypothetical protein
MKRLQVVLGDTFLAIDYDELIAKCSEQTDLLWRFLDIVPIPVNIPIDHATREKWRSQLSPEEVLSIQRITGQAPPNLGVESLDSEEG